jgi:transmembrane sensor
MQDFNHYKLEDFLADSDFCHWVLSPDRQRSYSTWSILKEQNPAAGLVMDQAAQLIRYAQTSAAELPESQVNQQITRILKDARTLETVMPLPLVKPLISWKKLLIAASVLVSVALGWMLYLQNRAFPNQSVYHAVDDKKETLLEAVNQAQDLKTFELPDKSKITLYPKSRLSYKKAFGENGNREVYLEGKAFFLVRKDETHPFLVFANGLLTRVVGTSFHVETTTEGANVKVRTGKVAVMPVEGKNKKAGLFFKQGKYRTKKHC